MRLALAKVVACQTCTYRPHGRQRLASLVRCLRRLLLASDCNFSRVDRCVVCWDGRAGNVLSKLAWKRRSERTRKRIETNGIGTGTTASAELSVIENRKFTYAPFRIAKTRAIGVVLSHPPSSPALNPQTVHLYLSHDETYKQSSMHQIHTVGFPTQSKCSQNQFSNLETPAKLLCFRCTSNKL